jgi:hypothetical protein
LGNCASFVGALVLLSTLLQQAFFFFSGRGALVVKGKQEEQGDRK